MASTEPLISIRESKEKLEIVNQLLLPHAIEYLEIDGIEAAHDAIKTMKIRGAPAIASLAALAFVRFLHKTLGADDAGYLASVSTLQSKCEEILGYLYTSRPTAVNLGTAIRRLKAVLHSGTNDPRLLAEQLIAEATAIHAEDLQRNKDMAKWAGQWLLNHHKVPQDGKVNVLTVCNTGSLATSGYGTALGTITYLHETERLDKAYYTQTAPYHQGSRLTAFELQTLQIPSVMICDTMVGSLFQTHTIHAVAVGADRIAKNGDTANKIGTYNAAVLAARHKIPFIVVAPISTVDLDIQNGSQIPIEYRPPIEACLVRGVPYPPSSDDKPESTIQVMITPKNLSGIYNPSFDVTPAELITAIATEKGVAIRAEGREVFDLASIV
ncbi:hypothetical protein CPB83DRAFT_852820 [Crepidotus variabilis]|uniref:Methylthioribose-1-phosphate isomerase n=1 Tax=Crepidotus variabilis TaxID=179855 RepID=A0A9P6JQG8_9AGAR|nr:hypothetical protein CPB83DRAFT_852820 [Crepidotus variabilis]